MAAPKIDKRKKAISSAKKSLIQKAVKRGLKEYAQTFKLLATT